MAKFYGTLNDPTSQRGIATKCGYESIRASAQSYDGSVITRLTYNDDGELVVRIEIDEGSNSRGTLYFEGSLDTLKSRLCKEDDEYD